MGFSQKHVAALLGHKDGVMLSRYEKGSSIPPLRTALQLEIIYRVPVAFLYGGLYDGMRDEIRSKEERLSAPVQPTLF